MLPIMAINLDNFSRLFLMANDSHNVTMLKCDGQIPIVKKELLLKD